MTKSLVNLTGPKSDFPNIRKEKMDVQSELLKMNQQAMNDICHERDVIKHENKVLKEENKKLTEEREKFKEIGRIQADLADALVSKANKEIALLKKENETLKEENETLEDENEDENEALREECEQLQDGNDEREEKYDELKEGYDLIYERLRSAEGTKELMTGPEPECIAESVYNYIRKFHEQEEELESLKEENEKLTYLLGVKDSLGHQSISETIPHLIKQRKEVDDENEKLMEKVDNLCEMNEGLRHEFPFRENVRLKEEIEELKTSLQTTTNYHTSRCHLLEKENAFLKEEEKELDLIWEWIKEIGVEDDPDIEEEVREWLGK